MVLICAAFLNPSPDVFDVICIRHYKRVAFIGATIMAMCVFLFFLSSIIVIGSPPYKKPCRRKLSPHCNREKKWRRRRLPCHIFYVIVVVMLINHLSWMEKRLPSPRMIYYQLSSISDCLDLPGVIPNDVVGNICADR